MCINPFHKTDGSIVPCSKCSVCKARRTSAWSFRLMEESKVSESAHFITLTYDTKTVPITQKGFMSLSKRDIQLFFKRLRKIHGNSGVPGNIKYYVVGEYGGITNRPHYHAILFNAREDLLQTAWANGQIHYGQVNGASIGYSLKYICKPGKVPKHANDDRLPEFALMSKGLVHVT